MSISDRIVVMKDGVVQQIEAPQAVYDDPVNLFVARFLGTPPINVFDGAVHNGRLSISGSPVLDVSGAPDGDVSVGVRPEAFILSADGPLSCRLKAVEVMGRDVSVVATHDASRNPAIRAIISAETRVDSGTCEVRFALKPGKVFLFDRNSEKRIPFGTAQTGRRNHG